MVECGKGVQTGHTGRLMCLGEERNPTSLGFQHIWAICPHLNRVATSAHNPCPEAVPSDSDSAPPRISQCAMAACVLGQIISIMIFWRGGNICPVPVIVNIIPILCGPELSDGFGIRVCV